MNIQPNLLAPRHPKRDRRDMGINSLHQPEGDKRDIEPGHPRQRETSKTNFLYQPGSPQKKTIVLLVTRICFGSVLLTNLAPIAFTLNLPRIQWTIATDSTCTHHCFYSSTLYDDYCFVCVVVIFMTFMYYYDFSSVSYSYNDYLF